MNASRTLMLTAALTLVATAAASRAEAAICSAPVGMPYLCSGSHDYGDDDFGAGYSLRAGLYTRAHAWANADTSYLIRPPLPADYAWAGARFSADATVLGRTRDLVEVELSGRHASASMSAKVLLRLFGVTLRDSSYTTINTIIPLYGVGISASEGFDWGIVSAEISASAGLGVTLGLNVSSSTGRLNVTGTPQVSASALLSAEVDVGCSASLEAGLTLLSVGIPVTAIVDVGQLVSNGTIAFDVKGGFDLTAVEGGASVEVDCGLGDWGGELFHYDGYHFGNPALVKFGPFAVSL